MKILVTGACGFAGISLIESLRRSREGLQFIGLDNLSRRGSEINLSRLKELGVDFIHGDLRDPNDLDALPGADWVIDCAANPSVLAGTGVAGTAAQVVSHNLEGTLNLLEYCRSHRCGLVLLSTSRVYSISQLNTIPLKISGNRFQLALENFENPMLGLSSRGIGENFPTTPPLSLYGSTKFASETMALEYGYLFDFPVWVNRCGVLAGPSQFGRIDQGILSYWIYSYLLDRPLTYIGYGGEGHQVRDFLYPGDMAGLILKQIDEPSGSRKPKVVNIGGGSERILSLAELTDWCNRRFGKKKKIRSEFSNRLFDIPYYVSDTSLAHTQWGWEASTSLDRILESAWEWAESHLESIRKFW